MVIIIIIMMTISDQEPISWAGQQDEPTTRTWRHLAEGTTGHHWHCHNHRHHDHVCNHYHHHDHCHDCNHYHHHHQYEIQAEWSGLALAERNYETVPALRGDAVWETKLDQGRSVVIFLVRRRIKLHYFGCSPQVLVNTKNNIWSKFQNL